MWYAKSMNCASNTPIVGNIQTISINRGTSLKLKARRIDYDDEPILTEADGIFFAVKKCWKNKEALILKNKEDMVFDKDGYYHFTIEPEETENLPYGKYVWDFTTRENKENYRFKPSRGYLIIGNSACWIINESEE